ncbi:MAG: hypothetical protein IPP03_12700 [Dechloromonas sp.]|jgi:hypothetical protein|nr:hypothetical protein [Candidatus Dechloromonas phosphoritropha]MBP8788609.1 hypothetical protein [Azonexus sp.]MBP9227020.1 hypothetical protein [Azonexus sp.]
MALVSNITHQTLQTSSQHTNVNCTYDIVTDVQEIRHLQLDTYGSADLFVTRTKAGVQAVDFPGFRPSPE